jgi:predicted TIM-barrel fold metal-dependent hydrolase
MKLGRFIVDTHVHAQRFAAGAALAKANPDLGAARYGDLAKALRHLTSYDNSARLLYDMSCYDVDMCVLLPAFGMSNDLNLQIVDANPGRFVAVCGAMETQRRAIRGESPWSVEGAVAELDALLATGRFVGLGEGMPADPTRKTTIGQTERMDEMRPIMELARKHRTVARVHTGMAMGYPLTHHYWPESLHPIWATDLAAEYPDVTIVLDHGGLQGWWSDRLVEEAMSVAAAHDNVYLETGLWWTDLYGKALRDPNIGAGKLLWGCDWGASIPFHVQYGNTPPAYAVQVRNEPVVRHQVDVWGWSLKQLLRLDIAQDDLNLILGGNAARIYGLKVPHTRLFRSVGDRA